MTARNSVSAWPLVAAFAVMAFVYTWTTRSNHLDWRFGAEQRDYYNLLVHGFLDGHLSLKEPVPQALLDCPNPYDPPQRPPGVGLHDASLYHGKYYIYYGVVPAVVLLLPFRLIAGFDLPVPVAVLTFALAAYVVALLLIADLRRRYFARVGPLGTFLLAVAFGFASCAPILVRRSSMYELPITSGSFFALGALACFYRALLRPEHRLRWIAISSLAWGLAIGARPTYLLAPICLAFGCAILLRDQDGRWIDRGRAFRLAVAAVLPLTAIGILLAWYNYARFGSPTEFGVSYILSGVYEAKIEHFRLRYVAWNVYAYLFAPAEWGRYFPFFHEVPITLARPRQHYGMDYAFSLLVNIPLLWLGLFAWLNPGKGRSDAEAAVCRVWVRALSWVALAVAGFLVFFYAAMARYLGDFAPMLALLAVIGELTVWDRAAHCTARWRRRFVAATITAFAVTSIFVVLVVSMQIYERLETLNPKSYSALERIANAPAHAFDALMSPPTEALEIQLELPLRALAAARQELLHTGWAGRFDRVLVEYVDESRVILEYEHTGAPPFRSSPIVLDRTKTHAVRIAFGSLPPPLTWSGYARWSWQQIAWVRRRLEVTVDGVSVLSRRQRFYESSPGAVVIAGKGTSIPFTGVVRSVKREPLAPLDSSTLASRDPAGDVQPPIDGVWRCTIRFPVGVKGTREPLLVSGETGRADFLVVDYLGEKQFRLLLDHWGSSGLFSEPVKFEPGHEYRLEISHPGYAVPPVAPANRLSDLVVKLDGEVIWRVSAMLYPAAGEDVFLGANPLGGSACGEKFGGSIRPEVPNDSAKRAR
jgi:hypothetical protein